MPHSVKISQGEHGLRPSQVPGQAAIAYLDEIPQLLDHPEKHARRRRGCASVPEVIICQRSSNGRRQPGRRLRRFMFIVSPRGAVASLPPTLRALRGAYQFVR